MIRVSFNRATGLGSGVALPGQVIDLEDFLAREFLAQGRASLVPGEPEPDAPGALSTTNEHPKKRGKA